MSSDAAYFFDSIFLLSFIVFIVGTVVRNWK